jgi:hypothetical protein
MEPRPLKTMIKSCLLKAIYRYELKIEEAEVKASDLYTWMKTESSKTVMKETSSCGRR